jgi:hypothetical protein
MSKGFDLDSYDFTEYARRSINVGSSGSNDAEKDTDPSLNRVLYASLSLLYGLRTVVHVFHGIKMLKYIYTCMLNYHKTCVETQTDDRIPITDESTQTETHSDEQALHNPTTLTQVRERSTQNITSY